MAESSASAPHRDEPILPRQTARELVADYARRRILTGEFPAGRKLQIAELAGTLGVSHTPTREGLQLLASEGLVRLHRFRGAVVSPLSADEYEEIFLMRVGLEGLAARLGAERIDDQGIAEMKHHLDDLVAAGKAGDTDRFVASDRAFHRVHYLASGRETLWERIISLRFTAERYTRLGYSLPTMGMADTVKSHVRLFEAVQRRDGAEAEEIIVSDLRETFEHVYRQLAGGEPPGRR